MALAVATVVCSAVLVAASGAVAGTGVSAETQAATTAGTWRTAREVPGTAALNQSGFARVRSVSCGSARNCSAGGFYWSGNFHPFVANEVNGTWRTAAEVSGTATLNAGGNAEINSLSCGSPGNCSAGGYYTDFYTNLQAFVVSETNGTWHPSIEVPGTAALNQHGDASVDALSCASAGNCTAGGYYMTPASSLQAFVVSEVNGTWHTAITVRRTAAFKRAAIAEITSVSCASAGNCTAGGIGYGQAFVVSEVRGKWHAATALRKAAALKKFGDGWIYSVSCSSAGNCSVGGSYGGQAFVASEAKGIWHRAIEVPGIRALNTDGDAQVSSVSCASPGNCSAGGYYHAGTYNLQQAFVATEVKGIWHRAIKVPGTAKLNKGGSAQVQSVSCPSAGKCSAGGYYSDRSKAFQAFVVTEVNGRWRTAIEVPGTRALNKSGNAAVYSVSCKAPGKCSAGGQYGDGSGKTQAFVVNKS